MQPDSEFVPHETNGVLEVVVLEFDDVGAGEGYKDDLILSFVFFLQLAFEVELTQVDVLDFLGIILPDFLVVHLIIYNK